MIYDVVEKFERDLIERTKLEKIDWKDLRALKENEFPDIPLTIGTCLCTQARGH